MKKLLVFRLEPGEEVLGSSQSFENGEACTYVVTTFGRKVRLTEKGARVVVGPPLTQDERGASEPPQPVPVVKVGDTIHCISSEAEARREPRHRCIPATVRDVGDRGLVRVISPALGGGKTVPFSSRGFVAAQYRASTRDQRPGYTWHTVCLGDKFREAVPDHVRPGDDL